MRRVLIPTKLNPIAADMLTKRGFDVITDSDTDLATQVAARPDINALIVRSEKVTAEIIDSLPNLKVVVRAGAGYDNIDFKHARRRGIDVMNTPGANANGVAEEVVALILAAYRKLVQCDITTRAGQWEKKSLMGRELAGKTVGIVGLGNIGQLLVRRLSGFETPILAYDPVISATRAEELGVRLASLPHIFEHADIISLHVPETEETRGLVNHELLSMMKPGATIVNCARAGVINEDDLRAARKEKGLVFCNDVYPRDEAGPKSVTDIADIMVPHIGANTEEANINAARRAADQLIAYIERGVTTCVVNRAAPEGCASRPASTATSTNTPTG
jgi:D-3-phosphoglycerate dehydrogenase